MPLLISFMIPSFLCTSPISLSDLDNNVVADLIPGILQFLPGNESLKLIHTPSHKYRGVKLGELHTMQLLTDRGFRARVESRVQVYGGGHIKINHESTVLDLTNKNINN